MKLVMIKKKSVFRFFISLFCISILNFFVFNLFSIRSNTLSTSAIDENTFQNRIASLINQKEKIAYLTFDDGPTLKSTPKIKQRYSSHFNAWYFWCKWNTSCFTRFYSLLERTRVYFSKFLWFKIIFKAHYILKKSVLFFRYFLISILETLQLLLTYLCTSLILLFLHQFYF